MSTNVKPLQGRHRAAVDARPPFASAALPKLLGGLAVVLLTVLVFWQVA
jgi:hypothetical protein